MWIYSKFTLCWINSISNTFFSFEMYTFDHEYEFVKKETRNLHIHFLFPKLLEIFTLVCHLGYILDILSFVHSAKIRRICFCCMCYPSNRLFLLLLSHFMYKIALIFCQHQLAVTIEAAAPAVIKRNKQNGIQKCTI